jgi:3-oxoacyl-[acyl-carrier-protein] synthase-3
VTSDEIDERLTATYKRVGLRPGLLERLAGIRTRRWWADGVTFVDGAAMAGAKAMSESGVDPRDVGVMVNT